jgi:heterodisulfide reductase subunit B
LKKYITYFPGCVDSQNKRQSEEILERLGFEARSVLEWNCCAAPPSHYKPDFFNKVVMPLRNLGMSQQKGGNFLYSGCQVCVRQINEAVKIINSDSMFKNQADYSLEPFNANLKETKAGSTGAVHLLDIIADPDTERRLFNNASKNINGSSILLYTGCYHNNENINRFKNILNLLGAEVNLFGECCGGEKIRNTTPVRSKRIENINAVDGFFKLINKKADEIGSDYILAICSMCEKNISDGIDLSDLNIFAPIIGLTEFIGFLFGMDGCGDLISGGDKAGNGNNAETVQKYCI